LKVISLNIGEKREVLYRGKKVQTGIFKTPVTHGIFLGKEDVAKDQVVDRRYHGGIDKACYIYSKDHYAFWQQKYPTVDMTYGALGENITLEGLNEDSMLIGANYKLGDAIVQVSQPRQPCFKQGIRFGTQKIVKDFFNSPYPGVYLRVIQEGIVNYEDEMILIDAPVDGISVAAVHSLFTYNKSNSALGQKAIKEPFLAASYKKDLIKIFDKS
jgi:MOSC domain-containing protein YiiM